MNFSGINCRWPIVMFLFFKDLKLYLSKSWKQKYFCGTGLLNCDLEIWIELQHFYILSFFCPLLDHFFCVSSLHSWNQGWSNFCLWSEKYAMCSRRTHMHSQSHTQVCFQIIFGQHQNNPHTDTDCINNLWRNQSRAMMWIYLVILHVQVTSNPRNPCLHVHSVLLLEQGSFSWLSLCHHSVNRGKVASLGGSCEDLESSS